VILRDNDQDSLMLYVAYKPSLNNKGLTPMNGLYNIALKLLINDRGKFLAWRIQVWSAIFRPGRL